MSLSCGGRGPCCHVGYPHRHCEHCDTVIATYHHHYYQQPYYGTFNQLGGLLNGNIGQFYQQALGGSADPGISHMHVVEVQNDGA